MNPIKIIAEYYEPDSSAFEILVKHGKDVAFKALKAAESVRSLSPDLDFIEKAAMLHDLGIFMTDSPDLACYGDQPYICHGIIGRNLLEKIGLPQYGLVCERHVGVGISIHDIRRYHLPLPERNMLPISIEEQIICYADKFFSKNGNGHAKEKSVEEIKRDLKAYGPDKVKRFQDWVEMFGG